MGYFGNRKPLPGTLLDISHTLSRGLVGCWPVNDNPPVLGILHDVSGNGNYGTLVADTHIVPGKFGMGLKFDGTGDKIIIPNSNSLQVDYFTYVAWICVDGAHGGGIGGIWWDGVNASRSRILILNDGSLYVQLRIGGVDDTFNSAAGVVPLNKWCQIVVTHNGVNQYAYVNAIQLPVSDNHAGTLNKSTSSRMIGEGQSGTMYFNGQIDHVMIYNRALSAGEVQQLYIDQFCMFYKPGIELFAATWGEEEPPVGGAGIMTTNTGYWGATY